jgi:Mrp family chromosome partitioning ATPase
LVLGLSFVLLFARFDRRIREPEDLVAIYRLPLLGVVPGSVALSRSATTGSRSAKKREKALQALPPNEAEAFQLIRAHMRYLNVDRDIRTLVVTSAAPRDGKTTVARYLAIAAASVGESVLLIEADLRRPTLAHQLDAQPGPGLSDVLIGAESLWSTTQLVELDCGSAGDSPGRMLDEGRMRPGQEPTGFGGRSLDLLVAGDVPPNPGELIESAAMEALLERAKSTYDLVVIDTTPSTVVSDAFPLLRKVDGVIIVGRLGRTSRDAAERLNETFSVAGGPLLGVVANGVRVGRSGSHGNANDYAYVESKRVPTAAVSANGASSDEPTFGTWA